MTPPAGVHPPPPPPPFCWRCNLPVHADPAAPHGYVHARSLRARCADGGGTAALTEPTEETPTP